MQIARIKRMLIGVCLATIMLLLYTYLGSEHKFVRSSALLAGLAGKAVQSSRALSLRTGSPVLKPTVLHVSLSKSGLATSPEATSSTEVRIQPKSTCSGYFELRQVNFFNDKIRERLCHNVTAYATVNGRYPLCQLSNNLPNEIVTQTYRIAARKFLANSVTGHHVTIMGYNETDYISREIAHHHEWEPRLVSGLIKIMLLLPQGEVTFLDVGSNIGVYSLQAVDAGFPAIAVDANIRNLVRIQLAIRHMGWSGDRLRLIWTFFHTRVSIRYLEFSTGFCNIGGAGGSASKDSVTDTVPVMTAAADDLLPHVRTRLIVMKIDIEGSERLFFETGVRLMEEKQVVAVQMEWWRPSGSDPIVASPNHRFLVDYFISRNYVLLSPTTLSELEPETFTEWDTLWVRRDFLETVRASMVIKTSNI